MRDRSGSFFIGLEGADRGIRLGTRLNPERENCRFLLRQLLLVFGGHVLVVIKWQVDSLNQGAVVYFAGNHRLTFGTSLHNCFEGIDTQFSLLLFLSMTSGTLRHQDWRHQFRVEFLIVMISSEIRSREKEGGNENGGKDEFSHGTGKFAVFENYFDGEGGNQASMG